MMQPVGNMLGGNPASGAVFHQADIIHIRHLGTTDTLINPAHNIAQNTLGIVLDLAQNLGLGPLAVGRDRNIQNSLHKGTTPARLQLGLHGKDIHLVIMQRMQSGSSRARHPSTVGTRFGVLDLLLQHGGHHIRHRPHTLADLGLAAQTTLKTNIDILVLIATDPSLALDEILTAKGTGFHRGVNFIARPIQKAGVDKGDTGFGGADTFFQVHCGAAFLIHNADFDSIAGQAKDILNLAERAIGERDLFRPVHLGLHDIDRPFNRIAAIAFQIMHGDQRGDHRIHQTLKAFIAVTVQNGRVGHQVAHIADQHQGAAFQRDARFPVRASVRAVLIQTAGDCLTALLKLGLQVTAHQAQPVGIGLNLVFGIHTSNRILAIHDRRKRGFQNHIRQSGLIAAANWMGAVKDQFHMQPVVAQHNSGWRFWVPRKAHKLGRIGKRQIVNQQGTFVDIISLGIRMAAPFNRERFIQKHTRPRNNAGTVAFVVAPFGRQSTHRVSAIKPVVQAAPTGIGRVQRIARIGDRHDKLRASDRCNLGVHIGRFNRKSIALRQQIPDLAQELLIRIMVMRLVAPRQMPLVNLGLNIFALLQQSTVFRAKVMDQGRQTVPKCVGRNARPVQGAGLDKLHQFRRYLKLCTIDPVAHRSFLFHKQYSQVVCGSMQQLEQKFPIGNKLGYITLPISERRRTDDIFHCNSGRFPSPSPTSCAM